MSTSWKHLTRFKSLSLRAFVEATADSDAGIALRNQQHLQIVFPTSRVALTTIFDGRLALTIAMATGALAMFSVPTAWFYGFCALGSALIGCIFFLRPIGAPSLVITPSELEYRLCRFVRGRRCSREDLSGIVLSGSDENNGFSPSATINCVPQDTPQLLLEFRNSKTLRIGRGASPVQLAVLAQYLVSSGNNEPHSRFIDLYQRWTKILDRLCVTVVQDEHVISHESAARIIEATRDRIGGLCIVSLFCILGLIATSNATGFGALRMAIIVLSVPICIALIAVIIYQISVGSATWTILLRGESVLMQKTVRGRQGRIATLPAESLRYVIPLQAARFGLTSDHAYGINIYLTSGRRIRFDTLDSSKTIGAAAFIAGIVVQYHTEERTVAN